MLRSWFDAGGPLMWPLLVCSIFLCSLLLERSWAVLRILMSGACRRPDYLSVHKRFLPFFIEVPPAIGLLGTVLGVVQSFRLLDGGTQIESIGTGLAVACTTTVFGVGIAVVAATANHMLDWMVKPYEKEISAR